MSQSLNRILRLREQSEEICRAELKREVLKLRALELAIDASREESRASRREAYSSLSRDARESWLLAESTWELAEWQIRSREPARERQRQRVTQLRDGFVECRKEKCQVEQLIEAETRCARTAEARRQQSALDDWYERAKRRRVLDPR